MNDVLFVKMKETVDTYQNLYQVRNVTEIILPDNYMDRVERLRFNMVSHEFNFFLFYFFISLIIIKSDLFGFFFP